MMQLLSSIPSPSSPDLGIGPLQFRFYGLAIAFGVLAAVSIARRRWEARGGDPEDVTTLAIVAVPAGLIGARLYHVITDFSDKYSDGRWWPDAFMIWKGGLGIPGGVLLGVAAGVYMCHRLRIQWRHVADAAAPAIPVAQAIGRLGNWFNQELYGRPTELPWALRIDQQNFPLGSAYAPGTTFHPTFLYEGLWNLALAGLIVLAGRRLVLKPGRWFAVYVLGYGLGRLWVESLRVDFATEVFGFRVNTWISLIAIVGGVLWLFWKGSPVDGAATAELRAGGNPQGSVGVARPLPGDVSNESPEAPADADSDADSDSGGDVDSGADVDSDVETSESEDARESDDLRDSEDDPKPDDVSDPEGAQE